MDKSISLAQINQCRLDLANTPGSAALAKATANVGPYAASHGQFEDTTQPAAFSDEIETGAVTNQKRSGRCWLFSDLNTMRHFTSEKFGIEDLEFSQNYLSFFDRLEKANLFLEHVISTAREPLTNRTLSIYLEGPDNDGGYYENAVALVQKYGVVPKSVMPETVSSENTTEVSATLNLKLRRSAVQLRQQAADGAGDEALRDSKDAILSDIYRILAYSFGNPPTTFDFEYRDKDKKFHADRNLTPMSFFNKYIGWNLDDYVTILSTPEQGKEYYKSYGLPALDSVVGGRAIKMVNVPQDVLEQLAVKQIQSGETVWFGNDVLADMDRTTGTLHGGLFDLNGLFDADFKLDKGNRFATGQAMVSHAMTLTGVDLVDGKPSKWKVENSWGSDRGRKGYFTADAAWFKDYVYQVVIKKSLLPQDILDAYAQDAIDLPAWDSLR